MTAYAPRFTHLSGVTVDQLLGFEVQLKTAGRVDEAPDREAALRALLGTTASPQGTGRYYSDIHAMVLRHVIEAAAGERLYAYLDRVLLTPLGMRETFAAVPKDRLRDCGCYDREHRIEGDRWIIREGVAPGMPHDPKARILSPDGTELCGHAGLFATVGDMIRLCQGILRGQVLSPESLRAMSRNRLGRPLPGGGWTQYLGSQCYVRHPNQYDSEIPVYMGRRAIGLSGFTGNHISIDP